MRTVLAFSFSICKLQHLFLKSQLTLEIWSQIDLFCSSNIASSHYLHQSIWPHVLFWYQKSTPKIFFQHLLKFSYSGIFSNCILHLLYIIFNSECTTKNCFCSFNWICFKDVRYANWRLKRIPFFDKQVNFAFSDAFALFFTFLEMLLFITSVVLHNV